MTRRLVLPFLLACIPALAACSSSGRRAGDGDPRPSILLVTLDTFRADASGCGGSPAARTPQLDRLARRGIQFTNAVSASPLTLPSHATMLTGLYPPRHGARGNAPFRVTGNVPTLAEALAERGWATGAFLAAAVLHRRFGAARGFDVYDDDMSTAGAGFHMARRPGRAVADSAAAWARSLPPDTRRFEWVHLFDAHQPSTSLRVRIRSVGGNAYLAGVADADAALGRRLRAAERAGDRAHVIVLGDHGESLGQHREDTHGVFLYDATMRVPAVLAPAPEGMSPGPDDRLFRTIDFAATAFDLLGLDPDEAPGRGRSALRGEAPPAFLESRYAYVHFGWAPLAAVTDGRWKYVEAPQPELYDLARDPGETTNVLDDHPERAAELAALVAEHAQGGIETTAELDAASREALESLGYVTSVADAHGDFRDPKEMIRVNELLMRATRLSGEGNPRGARSLLARAIRLDPDNKWLHRTMGAVLVTEERWGAATESFLRCLALPPDSGDPYPHAQLGLCFLRLGNAADAKRHLDRAVELDAGNAQAWAMRGYARRALGDEDGARSDWRRALEIDPEEPLAKQAMP
jgi:arylsulfatase A-like enzyme